MIGEVSNFSLDLSQIISIELITTIYDDEVDKIIFTLRPNPQYVYMPSDQMWVLAEEPITIVRKFINSTLARQNYEEWIRLWNEYTNQIKDIGTPEGL